VRKVVPELKAAALAFKKGKLADAEKLATEVAGAAEGEVKTDAEYVLRRVQDVVGYWKGAVEEAERDGLYDDAFDALESITKHYAGTDAATEAGDKLKTLKADKAVQNELKLAKQLEKYKKQYGDAVGDARKLKTCAKRVQKFIESNQGTKAAKRAEGLLKIIEASPGG